jgi:hypothetical protein
LLTLLFWVGGCGGGSETRFCFGSSEFCSEFFTANRDPIALAGPDLDATSGDLVELDGSGSRDDDGTITAFSWAQLSGEPVAIVNGTKSVASFEAPFVDVPIDLVFRLTVTDNQNASGEDTAQITVIPRSQAAAVAGLMLLKNTLVPEPLSPERAAYPVCVNVSVDRAFVGLWVIARIMAFERGLDLELTSLLDELRVVMHFEHSLRIDFGESIEFRLYVEGLKRLRTFAGQYDPAVSDLAGQRLAANGAADEIDLVDAWLSLGKKGSRIVVQKESPDEIHIRAIETLLGQKAVFDPIEIANATRIVLLDQ